MTEVLKEILQLMTGYTIIYPVFMSVGWIVGAICFHTHREKAKVDIADEASVTIVVSMFNEADLIEETMAAIKKVTYENLKVVLVDDASTDETVAIVKHYIQKHHWTNCTLVEMSENGGKACALNFALTHYVDSDYITVIDADSIIDSAAISKLVENFDRPEIAAVTGKPIVRNRTTVLGTLQALEYVSIIDTIKRAQQTLFHKIMTVSGVLVMHRVSSLKTVGGFNPQVMTEDIDVTWRFYKFGYQIKYEPRAITHILVPEKLKGFIKQRTRWSIGGVEVFNQNIHWVLRQAGTGTKFLMLEMFFSHLWSWSFIISTLDFVISVFPAHDFKLSVPIMFIYIFMMVFMTAVSLIRDGGTSKISVRDLFVWPIYYLFYWVINLVCSIKSEFVVLFTKKSTGTWVSPDRGV
ncbi:glycosyltransferase [Weissella viridescens]|uniref:glycosyltransferase n=1 Tax=Weissella viridescens TaxID=1629 RepID=UPI00092F37C7|nr:glycosyltransferase family 2 protein [Weissella viridescens]